MNANFLRSCGLAALLAVSAVAEPTPQAQPAKAPVAPAVQAVKKAPAPDRITSNDEEPAKKVAPAPAKPSAPASVNQKPAAAVESDAKPVPPSEVKLTDKPVAKPAAAAPSKITQGPAVAAPAKAAEPKPAAAAPAKAAEPKPAAAAPAKAVETKPAAATPVEVKPAAAAPAKAVEAKPAAATPAEVKPAAAAPAKAVETKPAAATPAEVKPAAAAPAKAVETKPAATAPAKVIEARPAATAPAKPAAATPGAPAKAATAKPAPAAPLLTENLVFPQAKTELKRLMIGNQAGIVKVLGPNREGVSYVRGIDDKTIARFNDDACGSIFCALGISHDKLNTVAVEIMTNYSTLPRKEAVAFLGAIVASAHLTPETDAKAEEFLVKVMETDKDVHARRQSVLALAVKNQVCSLTTEHVLALYEHSENLWETFPVQQYFEYHAGQVKRLENFTLLRERIAAVKSLYTPAILAALDGTKPVTVAP
jgi:hypothetical protein